MAGYADIIRNGIALADSLTTTLQSEITHYAWETQSSFRGAGLAAGVQRKAIVEKKQRMLRMENGKEVLAQTYIFFPRPVAMSPKDKIVLADGSTGPILNGPNGVIDADSDNPYYREVWLG